MKAEPKRVGTVHPSSKRLAALMAKEAWTTIEGPEDFVVEIGPGTGCITRALLDQGIAAERLICIELDPELHAYMEAHFPEVQTILGDATNIQALLDGKCDNIAAVVSGVPFKNLPPEVEKAIITACCEVIKPQGKFIQFTYLFRPPTTAATPHRKLVGYILRNFPPAFVWSFEKVGG